MIATDQALGNVRLSYRPRYSGRLVVLGCATLEERGLPGRTTIGRGSLISRVELIDTIVHEEMHHRVWLRAQRGSAKSERIVNDLDVEEGYVEAVTLRFLRCKGLA